MARPASQQQDQNFIREQLRGGVMAAQGRPTPQAGGVRLGSTTNVDTARSDQFRDREMELARQLGAVASGQQKGAGELAVGRQVGSALGQAYGVATMARGNSAAGGARASARAAGSIGLGGAGMAKEAALGDQSSARAQLAAVLGQGRGADIGIASQNAGAANASTMQQGQMDQATQLANMEAQLRARGMNDQAIAQYLGMLTQNNQFNMGRTDARNPTTGQQVGGYIAQAGQIAPYVAAASDERVKVQIVDAANEIDDAIAALAPFRYEYADPAKHGVGSRVGVMAQDLAATSAGSDVVVDENGVLMIDLAKAVSLLLAGMARLGQRISDLEAAKAAS